MYAFYFSWYSSLVLDLVTFLFFSSCWMSFPCLPLATLVKGYSGPRYLCHSSPKVSLVLPHCSSLGKTSYLLILTFKCITLFNNLYKPLSSAKKFERVWRTLILFYHDVTWPEMTWHVRFKERSIRPREILLSKIKSTLYTIYILLFEIMYLYIGMCNMF